MHSVISSNVNYKVAVDVSNPPSTDKTCVSFYSIYKGDEEKKFEMFLSKDEFKFLVETLNQNLK